MSRGPGYLQRYLFGLIQQKPMTFAEIRKIAQDDVTSFVTRPSMERSLRRALLKMVRDGAVITEGRGDVGNPYRYHLR
jgi:DNA-binding PadR family transcriptional regulator